MPAARVGQLFILGFRGQTIPQWLRDFAARFDLGGVILFDYNCQTKSFENNIASPAQLKKLCADLHALPSKPLIFVDQEGGRVRRLKENLGFAPLPSQQNFPSLPAAEQKAIVERSFAELKSLGFHYDLAPVIDLNTNPKNPDIGAVERSYSVDPAEVRRCFELVNNIALKHKLGLCLKHFPGLGGATVNSHLELTDLTGTVSNEQLELFYSLGKKVSGASVLVSHGIIQDWERDTPVSMSKVGIAKLRERLPDALLISDDLQMQGLQRRYPTSTACAIGIKAGLDMLCIGNNLMPEDESLLLYAESLQKNLTKDSVLQERVNASFTRVSRVKQKII